MSIEEYLRSETDLSEAEKRELRSIASAPDRSPLSLFLYALAGAGIPAFFLGIYLYLWHQAANSGQALCELHGTLYIPLDGMLEKILQPPVLFLGIAAVLFGSTVYRRESHRRLLSRLLHRTALKSADT